ncbi:MULTISPECIES: ribonuclease H family protein [Shewanella]|uniref:ribonuclease H family protein n=1 Tax=Shewanella TaxID=22 RepID=UPI000C644639|nr:MULTISPECIES: ribonuclease H family protein [Shewanella]NCQ44245.1 ribonuclease HI [Shewanella frigidimarina]NCO72696.1 ribonuclease HI [Shewanella vesiculosa]NCP35206.1 ribonuclease HI [Shewanella vesiculosa]NCP69881.1 ribonuclease HI [Shewanella vesiculosa]NCP73250.1 ribonuclease HI [Shewanella vesiculosa]
MAKKFYVVWAGRETGIFTSWDVTKRAVDKYPQAKYKSFATEAEAKTAFAQSPANSIGKSAPAKKAAGSATVTSAGSVSTKTQGANQAVLSQFDVVIYTDGGCEPNPGKAGSGMAIYRKGELAELWFGLYNPNGTNNTAELNALHQALIVAKKVIAAGETVQIMSDSQYSIKCVCEWAYGWKAKNWTRKTGEIANLEIIKQAHELYDAMKADLVLQHVAAHIGIEGNELADRMSIHAIDQKHKSFSQYPAPMDISKILGLRTG